MKTRIKKQIDYNNIIKYNNRIKFKHYHKKDRGVNHNKNIQFRISRLYL